MTWLGLRNILHVRVRNSGTIIHGKGGVFFGRDRYARQQNGVADILAWKGGKAYAIELKSAVGRLRPEQKAWLDRFTEEGGIAFVARSLDDVLRVLDPIGVKND